MMNDRYLMHHGVKGMKWGIRHDPEKAKAKQLYKETKRDLRQKSDDLYYDYKKTVKQNRSKYSNIKDRLRANSSAQNMMLIGQYQIGKAQQANKAILYKDLYGENSYRYKRGMKAVKSSTVYYQNFQITKRKDGSYFIGEIIIY